MGTLARIADDADVAQGAAARRRRIIVAATATVGALATTGWVAGLLPGIITILLWLPLLAFLPVAVLAERRSARMSAERALDERRRVRRAERADRSDRDIPAHTQAEVPMTHARVSSPTWEEVFDQTA